MNASQLSLPFSAGNAQAREDFIAAPCNDEAVRFIDSWPRWTDVRAVLYGPAGSGKSHLAHAWASRSGAEIVSASDLDDLHVRELDLDRPTVIEDVDAAPPACRDHALFTLLNGASCLLLTGREHPRSWPVLMPDLASRFAALLAFPLWAPDDTLLEALARKLFADRQLKVPDAVVTMMIATLERSPAAIRDFVARADAKALSEKRPVTAGLIRELLPQRTDRPAQA